MMNENNKNRKRYNFRSFLLDYADVTDSEKLLRVDDEVIKLSNEALNDFVDYKSNIDNGVKMDKVNTVKLITLSGIFESLHDVKYRKEATLDQKNFCDTADAALKKVISDFMKDSVIPKDIVTMAVMKYILVTVGNVVSVTVLSNSAESKRTMRMCGSLSMLLSGHTMHSEIKRDLLWFMKSELNIAQQLIYDYVPLGNEWNERIILPEDNDIDGIVFRSIQ